ncbi:MAG: hypothetical protein VW397_03245, partial [Candidatus Margulisiibacteriota bacterium]
DESFEQQCLKLILQFNLHQKSIDCTEKGYSPASIDAITRQRIVCKSFKGDSITEMFPFLKNIKTTDLRFHGREATNKGPARFSIHPTADMNIMHNGEINNIKSLRIYLSGSSEFRDFLNWQGSATMEEVLNQFSDTAIFSMVLSFQFCQGHSIADVLCKTFQPNGISYTQGFVAEGPATIMISHGNEFFLVNDSQGQRPAYLDVIKNEMGQIIAYRVGSVAGIDTPLTGRWEKVHVTPGVVKKITSKKDGEGKIMYFDMIDLAPVQHKPSFGLPLFEQDQYSSLPKLDQSSRLHRALEDHAVKVAMGTQRLPGPYAKLCTAGITNTSNSLGIDPSHSDVLFHLGENTIPLNPVLTHTEYDFLTNEGRAHVIHATLDASMANQMISSGQGVDEYISAILHKVESAIKNGVQTIDLRFIQNGNIPFFPRELLVNRISKLISNLGGDGLSDTQKVNLIVTTHALQHAQDAFTLINMGADFVYHPHFEGDSYMDDIATLRNSLMTLAMRSGISRLSQLKNAGLIHYEGMQTLASLLGVPNMGGEQFSLVDSLKYSFMQLRGVASDLGTKHDSDNQMLTMADALLMQNDATQAEFNRRNLVHHVYPVQLMPTEQTNLKPMIVVFGSGPAGISYIEQLPQNHYRVILVERKQIQRGGNARYIAGNHDSMYQSFNNRFQGVLDRSDVQYFGGARETARNELLKLADHVVDARGSVREVFQEPYRLSARDFLDIAYEPHISPDKVMDVPMHFKQKREFPGVLIQGVGNVAWDVLQALLCNDKRAETPSRLYEKWLTQFPNMPIYIMARRGPESLIWKKEWVHQLGQLDQPFRIFASETSQLDDEFQPYLQSFEGEFPSDGINLIFNAEPLKDGYNESTGQLDIHFGKSSTVLPFIGTHIQGFVPQLSPPPFETDKPVTKLGWSDGSGSMADIMLLAETIENPTYIGFGSANERLKNAAKLDDLAEKYPYINNATQIEILKALGQDRAISDHELTKIIVSKRSADYSDSIAQSAVASKDDAVPSTDVEAVLSKPLEEGHIKVFSPDGEQLIDIKGDLKKSVLKTLAEDLSFSIESNFDCGGGGTCSQCAAAVKAHKLPNPKPSEKALTKPVQDELGTKQVFLMCQLCNTDTANVVAGSHLLDIITTNKGDQ